ncbi:uncharacterized protein LOC119686230 isoform X2 [Teleopsis dalmanni]|uniref:uncharacterized protein LOC119686230 isoform X2 n=1 Tax=Teleopsis dalmanni TaxID=139649 RepID=UPI0018CD2586|nr:uncharacterized protein LOC119686230 isoform X2 [Teleopsis dalmanni]
MNYTHLQWLTFKKIQKKFNVSVKFLKSNKKNIQKFLKYARQLRPTLKRRAIRIQPNNRVVIQYSYLRRVLFDARQCKQIKRRKKNVKAWSRDIVQYLKRNGGIREHTEEHTIVNMPPAEVAKRLKEQIEMLKIRSPSTTLLFDKKQEGEIDEANTDFNKYNKRFHFGDINGTSLADLSVNTPTNKLAALKESTKPKVPPGKRLLYSDPDIYADKVNVMPSKTNLSDFADTPSNDKFLNASTPKIQGSRPKIDSLQSINISLPEKCGRTLSTSHIFAQNEYAVQKSSDRSDQTNNSLTGTENSKNIDSLIEDEISNNLDISTEADILQNNDIANLDSGKTNSNALLDADITDKSVNISFSKTDQNTMGSETSLNEDDNVVNNVYNSNSLKGRVLTYFDGNSTETNVSKTNIGFIDGLITKSKLITSTSEILSNSELDPNNDAINSNDQNELTKSTKSTTEQYDSDNQSEDFLGFDESGAFTSFKLDHYMNIYPDIFPKDATNLSNNCKSKRLFRQSKLEGLLTPATTAPLLLMPEVPASLQKLRTVSERRNYLQKFQKFNKLAIINNEAMVYRELQRKILHNNGKTITNSMSQTITSSMPFTRQGWKAASFISTDINKFYYQKVMVDNNCVKLFGVYGNNAELYKPKYYSKVPQNKLPICTSACLDALNWRDISPFKSSSNKLKLNTCTNESAFRPCPLSKKPSNITDDEDLNIMLKTNNKFSLLRLPELVLEVKPEVGRPLNNLVKTYMQHVMPEDKISHEWAKFSVSTLKEQGKKCDETPNNREFYSFPIPYAKGRETVLVRQAIDRSEKLDEYFTTENQKAKLSFRADVQNDNDDQIVNDCAVFIEGLINSVAISVSEDSFTQSDPDLVYENKTRQNIYAKKKLKAKCEIKSQNKKQRSLVMELKRLNATIVDAHVKSDEYCTKEYCKGGCVCDSLNEGASDRDHCKKINCMFECTCKGLNSTRIMRIEREKCNISTKDAYLIRQKATAQLAPIEKDFNSTIVLTNDSALLINDSEINRKRRSLKTPKRFEDFTGDEQNNSTLSSKKNCATSIRCNSNSPVTADVEKSKDVTNSRDGFSAVVTPLRETVFVEENQFNSLKHCVVSLNRFPIDNMVPFCFIHELYKCFCGAKATEGERFRIEPEQSKPEPEQSKPEPEQSKPEQSNNENISEIPNDEISINIINEPARNIKSNMKKSVRSTKSDVLFKYYNQDQEKTCRRAVPIPGDIVKSQTKGRNLGCYRKENEDETNRRLLSELILRSVYYPKNIENINQSENPLLNNNDISSSESFLEDSTSTDGLELTDSTVNSFQQKNTSCIEKTSFKNITDSSNNGCEKFAADANKKSKQREMKKNTKNKNILPPEIESDSSVNATSTEMQFDETSTLSKDSLSDSQLGDLINSSQNLVGTIDLTNDFNDADNSVSSNPSISSIEKDSGTPINTDEYEENDHMQEEQQLAENDDFNNPMKLKNFYEFVIKDMNSLVSKKMQDIDKVLKREKKIIPAPSCNIICVIKWKQFVEAYDENYVFVWKATQRKRTILVATIDCEKPSILNARKTEELNSFKYDDALLLGQLLFSRPNNEQTNNMAIILQGRIGYWLVRGFLIMDKQSACPKPTPMTHPVLTKKINILCSVLVKQRNNEYRLQSQQNEVNQSETVQDTDESEDIERGEVTQNDCAENAEELAFVPTENTNPNDIPATKLQLPKIASVTNFEKSLTHSKILTLPNRISPSSVTHQQQISSLRKRLPSDESLQPLRKKIRFSSPSRHNGSRRIFMPTRAALMTPMAVTDENTLSVQHEKFLKQLCEQAELKIIKTNIELRTLNSSEVAEIVHPSGIPGNQKWLIINLRNDFSHIFVPKFNILLSRDRIMKILKYSAQKYKSIKFQYFKNFAFDFYVTSFAKYILYFGPFTLNYEIPLLLLLQTVDRNIMLREIYQKNYKHINPKTQQTTAVLLIKRNNCFEVDVDEDQSEEIVIDSDSDDDVIIVENSSEFPSQNSISSIETENIDCEQLSPVATNTNNTNNTDSNNTLNLGQVSGDMISEIEENSDHILPKLVPISFNRGPILQIPLGNQMGYDIIKLPNNAVITNVATAPPEVSYGSTIYITSAPEQTATPSTTNMNISSINHTDDPIQNESNPAIKKTELNKSNSSPFKVPKLPKQITVTHKDVISTINKLPTANTSLVNVEKPTKATKRRRDSVRPNATSNPFVSPSKKGSPSTKNVRIASRYVMEQPLVFDVNLSADEDEPPASILIRQNYKKKNKNVPMETALPIGSYISMERITPIKVATVNSESLAISNTEVREQTNAVIATESIINTNTGEKLVLKPSTDFISKSEESSLEQQQKSNMQNGSKLLRVFKRSADGELKSGIMRNARQTPTVTLNNNNKKSSITLCKPTSSFLQEGPTKISDMQKPTTSKISNLSAESAKSLTVNNENNQESAPKKKESLLGYVTSDMKEKVFD